MTFDLLDPWPALIAFGLAFGAAWMLGRWVPAPATTSRTVPIDGLRGYLAFGVFLHHATLWYGYARTQQWSLMPSHLYTHLGQSSVTLFFMITGFLFFSKLLDARTRPFDWLRLYVSRVMRLAPLYGFAMGLLFASVAVLSGFVLHEPLARVVIELIRWCSFTILTAPDINGVRDTHLILAGVTWSLPYEWFFYLSLPLLALAVGVRPRWPWVVLGVVALIEALHWGVEGLYLVAFACGIVAAIAARRPSFAAWARRPINGAIVLALCIAVVIALPTGRSYVAIVGLGLAFVFIACGNDLFGALSHRASRAMGEVSYSVYLLHGVVLFATFRGVLGDRAARLSPMQHWGVVFALVPVLIGLCIATFRWIEAPGIAATPRIARWFAARAGRASDRPQPSG